MKVIIYKLPSGQIAVTYPIKRETETDQEMITRVRAKIEGRGDYEFVGIEESENLPPSREFRDQWRFNNIDNKVEVDQALELEERWRRIRIVRDKLLSESDPEMMRVNESGGNPAQMRTYRQELRDITNQPDPKNITWPEKPF